MQAPGSKVVIMAMAAVASVLADWRFDGTDDMLFVGRGNNLELPSNMTMAVRFYVEKPLGWQFLIARGSTLKDGAVAYGTRIQTNGTLEFYLTDTGQTTYTVSSSSVVQSGEWYTAVCVHDETQMYIYVNGQCEGTNTCPATMEISTNGYTVVGNWIKTSGQDAAQYFKGKIAFAALWERALTEPEISWFFAQESKWLWNVGCGLVMAYTCHGQRSEFDNGEEIDLSAFGNDASVSGGAMRVESEWPEKCIGVSVW